MMDLEKTRVAEHTSRMPPSEGRQQDLDNDNICDEETRDGEEIRMDEKEDLNPEVGMAFDSLDEVKKFYKNYACDHGFDIAVRTSKKTGKGSKINVRYHTFACDRGGKSRRTSKNIFISQPSIKTECQAKMNVKEFEDGRVVVSKVVSEHNHGLSPGQSRDLKSHTKINSWVKRRFELNDRAGNLRLGERNGESLKQDKNSNSVKNPYNEVGDMDQLKRYDALFNRFRSLATIGAMRDGSYKLLMEFLDHAEEKMQREKEVCDGDNERNNLCNMAENTSIVDTEGCKRSKRKRSKEERLARFTKTKNLDEENLCNIQQRDDEQEIRIDDKEDALNLQVGMLFNSLDEAKKFYKNYACSHGFEIVVRNSKMNENKDETVRYHTFTCDRGGKTRRTSKNILNYQLSIKTDCKAKINVKEFEDGRAVILKVVFEHNHELIQENRGLSSPIRK